MLFETKASSVCVFIAIQARYESFILNSKAKFDFLKLEPPKNVNKIIRIPESRNSVEMISTLGA